MNPVTSQGVEACTDRQMVEITEAVVSEDGVLRLYGKTADGHATDVKLGVRAQGMVLQALLGSPLDPLSPVARRFEPAGLSRFQIDDNVGLSFLLSPQIGIHFVLDRSLVKILGEMLATFDNSSTWRVRQPH